MLEKKTLLSLGKIVAHHVCQLLRLKQPYGGYIVLSLTSIENQGNSWKLCGVCAYRTGRGLVWLYTVTSFILPVLL